LAGLVFSFYCCGCSVNSANWQDADPALACPFGSQTSDRIQLSLPQTMNTEANKPKSFLRETIRNRSQEYRYETELSVEECLDLLRNSTIKDGFLVGRFLETGQMHCKINGPHFRLRQSQSFHNSFRRFFYGVVTESDSGSVVSGIFRLDTFVYVYMAIWFSILSVFGVILFLTGLGLLIEGKSSGSILKVFVIMGGPLLILSLGAGMVSFGRWLAAPEEQRIQSFLAELFTANSAKGVES